MRASPVDLIGGFYADDTLPWSCQDTVNWLPVMGEVGGTRTPSKLATPPGLKPYQRVGTGPIRGMHDLEGAQFVVSGRYLYRIGTNGVAVPVGVIPGVGRVSMTHNQFKTGYQLLVENGQGGGGYVYDSNTKAFARITDEGYPGSLSSDYLDSYLLGVEPQGRYWFHSNLADATDYNTLDRYESEASPDKIVGLAVSQLEVVVFNQRTIEFFYNAGGATGTFQNRRQSITRGCASRHTIAKLDNTLFWLGDDGIVYRLEGYSARPISTGPMHRAFAGKNWSEAFAEVWEDRGFKVYYLTFPDGMTFGYDVVSGLWTRRESFSLNRWRLSQIVRWGDKWYGGDYQDGRLWNLDWDYPAEGVQPMVSERTSGVVADNQAAFIIPNAELVFDVGQKEVILTDAFPAQPETPVITGDAPDVVLGDAYPGYTYTLSGGLPPYRVTLVSGALPAGLTITEQGVISTGSLSAMGGSNFTLRVTDANGLWSELADSIYVTSAVLSLGNTDPSSKTISKRSIAGVWSLATAGTVPTASSFLLGLPNGRFMAWSSTTAHYSDDLGANWTPTTAATAGTGGDYTGDALDARVIIGGGQTGNIFTSANSGATFTTRATGFAGTSNGCLFIKSGPSRGRIISFDTGASGGSRISDNDGASFTTSVNTTVNRTGGGSLMSTLGYQYVGGADPTTSKPKVVAILDGASRAKTLVLSSTAAGYVSSMCSFNIGSVERILMGTSTGEIYYSDDNLATFRQATFSISGRVDSMKFNGKNVVVGCSNNATSSTFSSMDGVTYVAEANTNAHSVLMIGVNG